MADRGDAAAMRMASGMWWLFLVTGILWFIISLVVLRFDETSVSAVGVLLGVVFLIGGVNEFMLMAARPGWKWAHALMGILFIVGAIACFAHPQNAFWVLASILGFLLVFKGTIDIVGSIMTRDENSVWWLGLIAGILEVMLAFWVSVPDSMLVSANRRAVLLILWVGIMAMFRGIGEIVLAFGLRKAGKEMATA